jgi:glutathione S-transferase
MRAEETPMADEIILHHYDTSPFSEKVRVFLGMKRLAWRSVIQPNIMPKPELVALTGGYRRAPVMQIGADVFCDSQMALAEIERRHPGHVRGGDWALNLWADRLFFQPSVAVIFGEIGDKVPKEFVADREKLSGRPFDTAAMKAAGPPMRAQWRAYATWLDAQLTDGPFVHGAEPSLADAAAYMNIWFTRGAVPAIAEKLMEGLSRIGPWAARVAALGHGARTEMSRDEALAIARDATPGGFTRHDPNDPLGVAPGEGIVAMADDYGRDPIAGTLVAANAERLVLARDGGELGPLHVHFPRAGYMAFPARA